jgi:hypothetical protein
MRLGWMVTGRATVGDFRRMRFDDQVASVVDDLQTHFFHAGSRVVANSFGAYLFLHAQAQMKRFPGKVLLLSPIVGAFCSDTTSHEFVPPRSDRLMRLVLSGLYPSPMDSQIHVGSEDWQSVPANVLELSKHTGIPVTVVPGRGHMLGGDYVGPVLDGWLGKCH